MSPAAIQNQIDAIERITAEALKSKESARKILEDAGIIKARTRRSNRKKTT